MDSTVLTITIIFAVFFVISIIISIVMGIKNKENTGGQKPISAPWQPERITASRYNPASPAPKHIESNYFDKEFGESKEIIKTKMGKALFWGTLLCGIAVGLFLYRDGTVTVDTGEAVFSPGGIGWYAVTVLVAGYGLYWYSWIFKKIVLYEKGFTYRNHFVKLKRVLYSEIDSTMVDKRFGWGMSGGSHIGLEEYWIMKAIWRKTVLQITFKTRRAVTSQSRGVDFWAFHYKDLEEKGLHLENNLQ